MNAKKAKAIRRAMRAEVEKGLEYRWVAHPQLYVNIRGEQMLKYTMQYIACGGKRLLNIGKKIYDLTGVLPRKSNGKDN